MAFTNAATIVVAQVFQLVDLNGVITAQLGPQSIAILGTLFPDADGIQMFHRDATTTDSSLGWSHPGTVGEEAVALIGPASAGAGSNRPSVILWRNSGIVGTQVILQSGNPTGVVGNDSTMTLANSGSDMSTPDLQLLTNSITLGGYNGPPSNRGSIYGASFHTALLGVNVNSGAGVPTIVLTINLPNAPVAGAEVHISWSAAMQNIFGAGTGVVMTIAIDGVQQAPFGQIQADVLNNIHTISGTVLAAVGVGAHTVTLRSTATGAANSWTLQAGGVGLEIVYYR